MCEHYDGLAEVYKRVTVSHANIDQAFYKNEPTFSFERYKTPIKDAFYTLRKYNQPKSNREEVEILLKKINTNNTQLTDCIQMFRHSYGDNFNDIVTCLSTQISQIFPDSQPGSHAHFGRGKPNIRCRNVAKAQTRNGKKLFNCVDITHTERYFPAKEWAQLITQGQNILNNCPKHKAKKEALTGRKKSKVSSTSTQNGNHNDLSSQQQNVSVAAINGVMQASTPVTDDDTLFSRYSVFAWARIPQIGTYATCNTSAVSTRSRPTYDHHGNVVHE